MIVMEACLSPELVLIEIKSINTYEQQSKFQAKSNKLHIHEAYYI
jgi:hypothetical protein